MRCAAPFTGIVICLFATRSRRYVRENLRRVRGRRWATTDTFDVMRTFSEYATCLSETLSVRNARRTLDIVAYGQEHIDDALRDGKGLLIVTAHTAGWEVIGSQLAQSRGVSVMLVEEAEPDRASTRIQDEARCGNGVVVVHVGQDPLAVLPIVRHLRNGGIVALQIDRVPATTRAVPVRLFGSPSRIPEGPARLSMLTGAPIVPAFSSRIGFRRYVVQVSKPLRLGRFASRPEVLAAMQQLADLLTRFVRAHPTQWFHFSAEPVPSSQ